MKEADFVQLVHQIGELKIGSHQIITVIQTSGGDMERFVHGVMEIVVAFEKAKRRFERDFIIDEAL